MLSQGVPPAPGSPQTIPCSSVPGTPASLPDGTGDAEDVPAL